MVVIVTKNKDGNVVTTVEELTKWLKKAEEEGYARGYSDGIKESWKPWSYTYTTPSITLNPCDNPLDPYKITCDNKHPDDALDALRFATNIDIRANANTNEECKILSNAINDIVKKNVNEQT